MGKSAEKRAKQQGKAVDGRPHKTDQAHPTGKSTYAQKVGRSAAFLEQLLGDNSAPPVPVAAPAPASPPLAAHNGGNSSWPALDAVIAEDKAHHGLKQTKTSATPLGTKVGVPSGNLSPRALLKHKNPEPRPKSSIIAPQYGRPSVADIDCKNGAIIDLEVIQAEGAAMKSQRRRLEQERLRQQKGSER